MPRINETEEWEVDRYNPRNCVVCDAPATFALTKVCMDCKTGTIDHVCSEHSNDGESLEIVLATKHECWHPGERPC